jgi:hypothetical protein
LTKIFEGVIIEVGERMKKVAVVIGIAILLTILWGIAGASEVNRNKVTDEFTINIVQPLEITCTVRGESKLGPGMSSNVAYRLKNNLEGYVIEVKYSIEGGAYLNLTALLYRPATDKEEVLAINLSGGGVGSEFSVNPEEEAYFIVKYTVSPAAPVWTQTSFKVTLEEGARIPARG